MLQKLLVLTMVVLLVNLGYTPSVTAQSPDDVPKRDDAAQGEPARVLSKKEAKRAESAKKLIRTFGVGRAARTEVKLVDKTKVKGYVSEAADEYFVITAEKTASTTRIEYWQVEKVMLWPTTMTLMKRDLASPSRLLKKVAISTIIVVGAVAAICAIGRRCEK